MRASEVILKKRNGEELSRSELQGWMEAFLKGEVTDYQMSAWLMAVFFQGMSFSECTHWTELMWKSGETLPRTDKQSFRIDKHSTGGVGDKTSLLLVPIVSAAAQRLWGKGSVEIPMISGRGLGHTGGTLDKLESITGFKTDLSMERALQLLEENDFFMIGQTQEIAPADKKIYALRDATGTVESLPLIVSSILSKKLSENLNGLVLDVKSGSAAFMKNKEKAAELAEVLVNTAKANGVRAVAVVTEMEEPLGRKIGNFLEVEECWEFLQGNQEPTLRDLVIELGCQMLYLAGREKLSFDQCLEEISSDLSSEKAQGVFRQMFVQQGGDWSFFEKHFEQLPPGYQQDEVRSAHSGYIEKVDALNLALWVQDQGGGRKITTDSIDPWVGIKNIKKKGEKISKGQILCSVIRKTNHPPDEFYEGKISSAFAISEQKPTLNSLILERIS